MEIYMKLSIFKPIASAVILFGLIASSPGTAQEKAPFSDTETRQIEKLIERYLDENPEAVVQAFRKFQLQQQELQRMQQEQNLTELRDQLENSETSPVLGNPEGNVTLVEFFDYRCGYCKRVHGTVTDTVNSDGNVKLVYKEFPILGPESVFAARAALGIFFTQPLKYPAYQDALMTARGQLSGARVLSIGEDVGLKPADIEAAMKDPRVDQEIQRNIQLAQSLGINGTPGFVIGQQVVPGAVDKAELERLIAEAREG